MIWDFISRFKAQETMHLIVHKLGSNQDHLVPLHHLDHHQAHLHHLGPLHHPIIPLLHPVDLLVVLPPMERDSEAV